MDGVTARIVCGMYGIEGTFHHPDLRKKWSAMYMMNVMFLVRGKFELFGAVNAGFAIGPGSIKQLFASGFFRGEKMRWDTKFL